MKDTVFEIVLGWSSKVDKMDKMVVDDDFAKILY